MKKPLPVSKTLPTDTKNSLDCLKPPPESTKYDARIRNVGNEKLCGCGGIFWKILNYEICGDCRTKHRGNL